MAHRLEYANFAADPKSSRHPTSAIIAVLLFVAVAMGEVGVLAYSFWIWGSNPHRVARTNSRFVDVYDLEWWASLVYVVGVGLALHALRHQRHRRSLAIFALILNCFGPYMLLDAHRGGPMCGLAQWVWELLGGTKGPGTKDSS